MDQKSNILAKRGGWKDGWDKLKKEGALTPQRRPSLPPNYLTHTSREELAFKVK